MTKFKVGDKVKCISVKQFPKEVENWAKRAKLKVGKVYPVFGVIGEDYQKLQVKFTGYYIDSRNFELYTEPKSIQVSIKPVKRGEETFYRYQFKSKNGEILNDLFTTKANAKRGAKKMIKQIQENDFKIVNK